MEGNIFASLPASLRAWRDIQPLNDKNWSRHWEFLRPFFREKGYDLFRTRENGRLAVANGTPAPANTYGMFGELGDGFESQFQSFATAFAARDSENRDVVIKVIAKGHEGHRELKILELLNTEPLKSDPANANVPVVEFLHYHDWHFVVMPFCDGSDEKPFLNAMECLEFTEQVLLALSFLHNNRIAHLDIAYENILINHHGKIPSSVVWTNRYELPTKINPPPEFRSTFPIRYYFIDFGFAHNFSKHLRLEECFIEPFSNGREQKPPEADWRKKYNPFAADVYQAARLFYGWFTDVVHDVPGFLDLLRDMSSYNPSNRICAAEALARFRIMRSSLQCEDLLRTRERELLQYPLIPRSFWRMFIDIVQTGRLVITTRFVWVSFGILMRKMWSRLREFKPKYTAALS